MKCPNRNCDSTAFVYVQRVIDTFDVEIDDVTKEVTIINDSRVTEDPDGKCSRFQCKKCSLFFTDALSTLADYKIEWEY